MNFKSGKVFIMGSAFGLALIFSAPATLMASGMQDIKTVYNQKCAVCHGVDGAGNTPYGKKNPMRDLSSKEVQGQSDDKLLQIIAKGGGGGKMPGYEKALGADTCKQLVGYIRKLGGK